MDTSLSDRVLRRLRETLGEAGVVDRPDRLLAYESDALGLLRGTPSAALFPRTTEELRRTVAILAEEGIPFVPRGAGTGLTGGAVARGEALLCTERMDRILALEPEDRRATVQPGVVTDRISEAAGPHGLRYLPDPASASTCTIGGNVAQNAGGPRCLEHGVTADHVLELRVVLPDGRLLRLRRGEEGGLDLVALFVGSEGTLGVVAEIDLRLHPVPAAARTALAVFPRLAEAGEAVSAVIASGARPVALELVDGPTIRLVEESPYAVGLPRDAEAVLVMEFEGEEESARAALERAAEAVRSAGAAEVRIARDEAERARLWRARKKAYDLLGREAPDVLVQDAAVPRTALPRTLPRIRAIAERHGVRLFNFFHAGDGNLHPNLVFDRGDPDQVARVERANREILEACVEAGGTITGEHGVGLDKREAMRLIFHPVELARLRRLRRAIDPADLCNPGKMLPEANGSEPAGPDAPGDGTREGRRQAMARYRKRDSVERRLSDGLEARGRRFTVDLIAKRATGIEGYKMTLAFLELDGEGSFFLDLEPAASREEANDRAEALASDPARLRSLLEEELAGSTS